MPPSCSSRPVSPSVGPGKTALVYIARYSARLSLLIFVVLTALGIGAALIRLALRLRDRSHSATPV